jgi:cell wall assembly regulator SMI1
MDTWTKIESWLKANCPSIYEDLEGPCSDQEIQAAEGALSAKLPPEAVQIYRGHNGQGGGSAPLVEVWEFLALRDMVSQWEIQRKLLSKESFANAKATAKGPVRPLWWSSKWLPVFYNGSGDLQCIDLDPADGGKVGQIVVYRHDRELRECIAGSLAELLETFAADLESGAYEVEDGALVRR